MYTNSNTKIDKDIKLSINKDSSLLEKSSDLYLDLEAKEILKDIA
jgi:hypothetical protein